MQDAYVVLPPSQSFTTKVKQEPPTISSKDMGPPGRYQRRHGPDIKPRIKVGNSETLARNREAREERERYERNKDAWYERNEHLVERGAGGWMGGGYEEGPCGYGYDYDEGSLGSGDELELDEDGESGGSSDIMSEDEDSESDGSDDEGSDDEELDGMDIDLFDGPQVDTSAPTSPSNSVRLSSQ
jgi:hypothetical protein